MDAPLASGRRIRPGRQEERLADLLPRLRLPEAGPLDPAALFPRPVSETKPRKGVWTPR
jgi:tRNA (guanine-N7-)-methyltransferase